MSTLISTKDVAERLNIGRSTVWFYVKEDPTFPRPHRLSPRNVRWDEQEIDQWLKSKKEKLDEAE